MIRPFTCVCFLLACGSGLYLYQSKHRVQLLDHEIEKTVRATDALREQIRVLHAEWTLLNDPQRLQALGDQFLSLKTVTPGQFTSMAELDNRLPAVRIPEPARPESQPPPVAETPETTQPEEPPHPPAVAVIPPQPPKLASVAVAVSQPRVVEQKPRPLLAEVQPVRPAPSLPRAAITTEPPRQVPPQITPAALPARLPSAPPMGSSLGMARGAAVPPPQPMPVSASQWVTNGGGG
jgi:hypothetical protein